MLNSIRIILTDTPVLTITTDLLLSGSEHLSVDNKLILSSSENPNALVMNHSYCQVHCLPICCFPYYITSFPNFNFCYVYPLCIVIFSCIYCNSTLSGEHIHYQEICTYITLGEYLYKHTGLSIQSLVIYICV